MKITKKHQSIRKRRIHKNDFLLSSHSRLTYVYKTDRLGDIIEVTTVSLDIQIENVWKTIVYFDSSHQGKLHRHMYVSLDEDSDIVDSTGIPKINTQKSLLQWAIEDIKKNHILYKTNFIERCKGLGLHLRIELY